MPEMIEAQPLEVIAPTTPPITPGRFEIPSFTDKKVPAIAEPPKTPTADSPPATDAKTEEVKPPAKPEEIQDPEAEKRKERLRVNRLYKQIADEKARREVVERQLKELQPVASAPIGEPRMEDFTDIKEYANAVAEWKVNTVTKEREAKAQAESANASLRKLSERWDTQMDAGAAKYEDFEQVVGDIKPTAPWSIAIMHAENAADVAYHMGSPDNLKDTHRIINLPPLAQIFEVARISAQLAATVPQPKKLSKAPAPISPVSGDATPPVVMEKGMEFEKFRRLRNKQLGRN